jgi:AcrB/AcrD/AcrF family
MAFLGVASLIGVIVSHVIVLFDFIEEMHEKGEPLERALPDAGIECIRPIMITVGATILALFPLALEGGPLCKPLLCPDWRTRRRYLHHFALGPRLLLHFRAGSQMDNLGGNTPAAR